MTCSVSKGWFEKVFSVHILDVKQTAFDDHWNRYGEGCGVFFRHVKSGLPTRHPSGGTNSIGHTGPELRRIYFYIILILIFLKKDI